MTTTTKAALFQSQSILNVHPRSIFVCNVMYKGVSFRTVSYPCHFQRDCLLFEIFHHPHRKDQMDKSLVGCCLLGWVNEVSLFRSVTYEYPMNCSQSCSQKNSYHIDLFHADNRITWKDTGVRGLQWEWGCPALAFLRVAYKDGVSVLFCKQRLDVTPIWEQLPAAIGLWHFMAVHSSCLFAVGNDTEMNGTNQSELDEVWRDNEGY